MAAKDNDIGTWSDWSVAVHATPWTEEPKHLTTEAQVTGEISLPLQTGCAHSREKPRSPPCPAPCKFRPQPRRFPQHLEGLQPLTLHFAPTHGPSGCNCGPRGADSAHLAPASSSPGCLGCDNEAEECLVLVFILIFILV